MMMRLKSQSLPETERNKQDFSIVAEGNGELNSNSLNIRRSNSALPQSNQEIRSAGKQAAAATKSKGAKRWKLLRMLMLGMKRNKNGRNRKRAGTGTSREDSDDFACSPDSNMEMHFDGKSEVHKITITKPPDDIEKASEQSEGFECIASEKRIMWDEATIIDTPSRKISTESQYNISNRALAAAVGKWKQSIRSTSPVMYESCQGVPRRVGVCEELEKTVVSDGTTLHELRKDLTVYLTLDELGML
ncbi:hypothetical protein QZH41_001611 [Actinostola sp. cb2023]|nr:hypothetical protein QZH41_001611 [Actinostola sp. cb2023]